LTVPDWVNRMESGHWYRISGDRPDLNLTATPDGTRYLQDNDPAADQRINPPRTAKERLRRILGRKPHSPWHGRVGFPAITEACNSAIFASRFGNCGSMIVFGGGHNNYFGSDIHAFNLASREWARIADGYVTGTPDEYGSGTVYPDSTYPDGSPVPPHTYDYVQYDPVGNDFLLFKGALALGPEPQAVAISHMFNLGTMSWRRGPKHDAAILNSGGWTTWDASRRILWGHSGDDAGGNAFIGFQPDGTNNDGTFGKWGELQPNKLPGFANHNAMQIDCRGNIIVVAAHQKNALFALDPAMPEIPLKRLTEDRTKLSLSPYAALEYAPGHDCFVYYSANHGGDIYAIQPPSGSAWLELVSGTWRWSRLSAIEPDFDPIEDAAVVTACNINRTNTFGRFRVANFGNIDLAILIRHVDTPVYAMKLI
jgi:hypothetical protein